ncbi:MAG: 50S ribosomal protein L18 [Defluviitaleaceae bacterium]|nr:50S ribosomal protein L18 [Defluviitaleaceae bacterium]
MIKKPSRAAARQKRHYKLRRYLMGTAERPRLSVFRSNKHIYAQVIDDDKGHTLASASTATLGFKESDLDSSSNVEAAKAVGKEVAEKAKALGIETIVFDRGGYLYHGKVKALADAAREAGLKF